MAGLLTGKEHPLHFVCAACCSFSRIFVCMPRCLPTAMIAVKASTRRSSPRRNNEEEKECGGDIEMVEARVGSENVDRRLVAIQS